MVLMSLQTYTKICYKCRRELPISEFCKDRSKKDGFSPECRECAAKRSKSYRERNKEKLKEKYQKYYAENRDKILERNRKWARENPEKEKAGRKKRYEKNKEHISRRTKEYYLEHRDYYRSLNRLNFQNARIRALHHLNPDMICENCEMDDVRVLTVDHKNNDGCKERRKKGTYTIYKEIVEMPVEEARKKYQVLCRNCNWISHMEWRDEF